MWFKESNGYFCKIENLAYGEINERSFLLTQTPDRLNWRVSATNVDEVCILIWNLTVRQHIFMAFNILGI